MEISICKVLDWKSSCPTQEDKNTKFRHDPFFMKHEGEYFVRIRATKKE